MKKLGFILALMLAFGANAGSPLPGILGQWSASSAPAGPNTWYYAPTWTAGTTGTAIANGWAPQSYAYGNNISVAQGGTVTTLSARMESGGGTVAVKMALYDSSYNLVVSGTGSVTTTPGFVDIPVTSTPISAGTYFLHVSAATSDGHIFYLSGSDGDSIEIAYASFPSDPASIAENVESTIFGVRVFVQ